eukprot:7143644-Prymnesium_polylepis.1
MRPVDALDHLAIADRLCSSDGPRGRDAARAVRRTADRGARRGRPAQTALGATRRRRRRRLRQQRRRRRLQQWCWRWLRQWWRWRWLRQWRSRRWR